MNRFVAQAIEQGFPEKVTDPVVLAKAAAILRAAERENKEKAQ